MSALRALLAGIVDYAGLFPPAGLPMPKAVAEYARALQSPDAWMLGRFVVNANRLAELALAASPHVLEPGAGPPWRVSALLGDDLAADLNEVRHFDATQRPRARVDTVEAKASSVRGAEEILDTVPTTLVLYVEVPLEPDPTPILTALASRGARAKARAGGLSAEAVPPPDRLARFLAACAALHLPFKATAGLHHPLRAEQAFTYAPDSPRGVMHGFLNVFVAAALLREGRVDVAGARELLAEGRPEAFAFEGDELRVGPHTLNTAELVSTRAGFAASFGSCSFADPVSDLRALGLLPAAS